MEYLVYAGITLSTLIACLLIKALNINQHWKKHGIPGPKPLPFFGNILPIVLGRQSTGQILKEIYDSYPNEPVVGYYHLMQPRLLIRDLGLLEKIFVKDFQHFTSRVGMPDVVHDPLRANLFTLNGDVWRAFRSLLSPMFTPDKIRHMFPVMSSMGDDYIELLRKSASPIDLGDSTKSYTIQLTSSLVSGIQIGPMDDENNEYRRNSRNYIPPGLVSFVRFAVLILLPKMAQKLGVNFTSTKILNYFTGIFKEAFNHRKATDTAGDDFVQYMVNAQKKGFVEIENSDSQEGSKKIELTDDVMAGQAFFLMFAGFVTTPLTLLYMIFDLATNLEEQEKARAEVKKITESSEGKITYDSLKDMEHLEGCMKESLRIHAPLPLLPRMCTKTYKIPDVPYTMSTGENIMVSMLGIHHDPDLYPEPQKFLPERWSGEDRPRSSSYLPWGYGPKQCVGMKFASAELKSVLAKLLLNFKISLHPSVRVPLEIDPLGIFNVPAQNLMVNLEKL